MATKAKTKEMIDMEFKAKTKEMIIDQKQKKR